MIEWLLVPVAYLIGSVSSAIIVCRLMGMDDPRKQGSGNPGATNVMRIGGKKAAAITLLGDALKGLLPVLIAKELGVDTPILALVAYAVFIGHLYPVFFGFKGGKGVATTLGVSLGVSGLLGIVVLATWLIVFKIGKISSLSALVTTILIPAYVWYIVGDISLLLVFTMISIALLWRHKSNIQRLITGEED